MKPTVIVAALFVVLFAVPCCILIPLLAAPERPAPPQEDAAAAPTRPLLVLTGHRSEIRQRRDRLAASQEVFDAIWKEHRGDAIEKAVQGWPMTPSIDFTRATALFAFDGDRQNSNGFRVMEVVEEENARTIRIEAISFQTASFDGEDPGVDVRPWVLVLTARTDKTIFVEENVQGLIGGPPIWKQRAAYPGRIGVGRPVPGTRQAGDEDARDGDR